MKPHPATQAENGGLRGRDKQQDSSRDQKGDHGVVKNERGEDQPKDKARARQNPGLGAQKEAALREPQSPGEPAGGE